MILATSIAPIASPLLDALDKTTVEKFLSHYNKFFFFLFFIYESTNFPLLQIQIDYNMRKILKYSFDSSFNFVDFKNTEVIILFVKEN
jgi:hypothetical protein